MFPQQSPNVIGVAEKDNKKEKVAWINKKSKFISTSLSFTTAEITGLVAKLLLKEPNLNFDTKNILKYEEEI
jgi:hypothetical protein